MKYALINPGWSFGGSVYFGCREPHLPLELGYSKSLLERAGHEAIIIDAQLEGLSNEDIRRRISDFNPDFKVITTAPSYLFWRCPPPEVKVPLELIKDLEGLGGKLVVIGPHGSTTPEHILKKLGADIVVIGEPESILPVLGRGGLSEAPSIAYLAEGLVKVNLRQGTTDMESLPALKWPDEMIKRHTHQHHRFGDELNGLGAEMETSRGCPYSCTFCAKNDFRNAFRKRPHAIVVQELDLLLEQGVEYIYFIDEIFMPDKTLLQEFEKRDFKFGIQTRIDIWTHELIELLGKAGCVSVECGIESISELGRSILNKKCNISTDELVSLLKHAKKTIPFVQATLLDSHVDSPEAIERWRQQLILHGLWANKPVPLFPYPGSAEYEKRWGRPDEKAWERAHEYYLKINRSFSDIQDERPIPLNELELIK
ncbi:MAG: TIGR04295 family B12-binding domain-containing radical SAM protein [Deltaproteobacteria bacterium]|nr:TIGR04295 family B12-binding domain-containing radical SAM protein [Deltaproteobacteria bacterium]